jgi:hypothetical protein
VQDTSYPARRLQKRKQKKKKQNKTKKNSPLWFTTTEAQVEIKMAGGCTVYACGDLKKTFHVHQEGKQMG